MRTGLLPKIALAVLVLTVGFIFLSSQTSQAAAWAYPPVGCSGYGYYNYSVPYWYYGYYGWYGYNYPYYYCNGYSYYGSAYPYYSNYYGYYSYPYYAPSKYDLTVTTDPASLGTATGGGTFDQGSSASFSITKSIIQTEPDTQYVFSYWSGDYSGISTSGSITMNAPAKVVAVYQLQYHLAVSASPSTAPTPQGEGWYNAGDTATLTAPQQMLGDQNQRLVFQGWSVDGKTIQAGVSLALKMNSGHQVTAVYKQQYYLKVLSDQGVAYGEGWYDAGSTANIFVSTPASTSYGVSILFNGWQGDIQSNSQSTSVLMDGPKTAIATWRTDSSVLNLTIALGIIAVFLIGAGMLAYVAVRRRGFQSQSLKQAPTKTTPASTSVTQTVQTPVKKETAPQKKEVPQETSEST
jgi:hypothetical protein